MMGLNYDAHPSQPTNPNIGENQKCLKPPQQVIKGPPNFSGV